MVSEPQVEQLRSLTAEVLGVDESEITDDSSSKTLPQWSSFNHLTLMSSVEETFGLTFSMQEMTDLQTFRDLVDLVHSHAA
jgi:acyl carrier protein